MNWPSDEDLSAMLVLPEGYRGARLQRAEIPALAAAIAVWHPDIAVGAASCYLPAKAWRARWGRASSTASRP